MLDILFHIQRPKGKQALSIKLTNVSPLKQPSVWLPLAMSLAALNLVVGHTAIFGIVHEADEGRQCSTFTN